VNGASVFVRGPRQGWFGSALQVPHEPRIDRFSPDFEPTADGLTDLEKSLVDHLFAHDPVLHSAIGDIDWFERVSALRDQTQRVALGLRLIERLLPRPQSEHWTQVVKALSQRRLVSGRDLWLHRGRGSQRGRPC
jgi:hypothetical protein